MEKQERRSIKILFLCTGNSCRSQMAEGWTRHLKKNEIAASSAGTSPKAVDPRAIQVMKEVGIDISNHSSECVDDLKGIEFDYVITVCGHAHETCPIFPGKTRVVHQGFDDPPNLAISSRNEEEALVHYRRVRDEIKDYVATLPESLQPTK